jgi:hypothetical protein
MLSSPFQNISKDQISFLTTSAVNGINDAKMKYITELAAEGFNEGHVANFSSGLGSGCRGILVFSNYKLFFLQYIFMFSLLLINNTILNFFNWFRKWLSRYFRVLEFSNYNLFFSPIHFHYYY